MSVLTTIGNTSLVELSRVTWTLAEGDWALVIMNTDGSAGVRDRRADRRPAAGHGRCTVTLIERVSEPGEVGPRLLLRPNGLAVLDRPSLAASLRQHGHRLTGTMPRASSSRTTLRPLSKGPGSP
jgi:hypothetical protein